MYRLLYFHGSSAGRFGSKTDLLERHGHLIVGRPRLPYPRHPRRSWRWLVAYFDQQWFRDAVQAAQECYDACLPDVIIGSSMGGAVAMNIRSGDTPQVLVAPAWRAWWMLRFGRARRVKPATVIVHGDRDRTVFPRASRRLLVNSRPASAQAGLVAAVEDGLRERLGGRETYRLEGRLVVVRGEDHRCNGEAALRALLTGVEVLTRPALAPRPLPPYN